TLNLHGCLALYSAERRAFDARTIRHYMDLAAHVTLAVTSLRRDLADDLIQGTRALRSNEERKRAQEAQRSARTELERLFALMSKGEMAAAIAHEINQPLAAIMTNGGAAIRLLTAKPPDVDEALDAVKDIVSDGRRVSQVITSIRAMFKHDSQEHALIEVNEIIRDIVALVHAE